MRTSALLASAIFACGCNSSKTSSKPGGNPGPDAGTTPSDAASPDTASAPDAPAGTPTLTSTTIVFAAALDGQAATDLYAIDASGTGLVRLTTTPGAEAFPTISPDRTQIAFTRDFQLFAIDATGNHERLIAPTTGRQRKINDIVYSTTIGPAAWSANGSQLAYPYPRPPDLVQDGTDTIDESYATTIHIINADGTNDHAVSATLDNTINWIAWGPADTLSFSQSDDCPDCAGGTWCAVIKPDGTGYRQILRYGPNGPEGPMRELDWSADGTQWVYLKQVYGSPNNPGVMYTSPAYSYADHKLGTINGWDPHWAPTGLTIAFIAGDGIYVIEPSGGPPRRILAAMDVQGLDW